MSYRRAGVSELTLDLYVPSQASPALLHSARIESQSLEEAAAAEGKEADWATASRVRETVVKALVLLEVPSHSRAPARGATGYKKSDEAGEGRAPRRHSRVGLDGRANLRAQLAHT